MEYQNLGRQQRPKGANMKQALLVMMLVVGCAWLIYQTNLPRHKPENYGGLHRPVEQYWAVSLGRKGTPSWLHEIQFPTLGTVHIEEPKNDQNSGNESDDKGQGNVENPKIAVINDSQINEEEAEVLQIRMNTEPEEVEETKTLAGGVGVHSFDDENGVPPEVNETETIGGRVAQIDIVHEDSKENGAVKGNILEVISSSRNDIVEVTFGGVVVES